MPDDYPAQVTTGFAEARMNQSFRRLYDQIMERAPVSRAANPYPKRFKRYTPEMEKSLRQDVRDAWRYARGMERYHIINSLIKHGNAKLPDGTKTLHGERIVYLIFNMNAAHACPSLKYTKDGMLDMDRTTCQAFRLPPSELKYVNPDTDDGVFDCYAWRSEELYPEVWPCRVMQDELWNHALKDDPELMVDAIMSIARLTAAHVPVALRFSEAGDFPDQKSVNSFIWIAEELARSFPDPVTSKWGLPFITYTYTARKTFNYAAASRVSTCTIMGSSLKKRGITAEFLYVTPLDDRRAPEEQGTGSRHGRWPERQWSWCAMNCRKCRRCLLGLNTKVMRH